MKNYLLKNICENVCQTYEKWLAEVLSMDVQRETVYRRRYCLGGRCTLDKSGKVVYGDRFTGEGGGGGEYSSTPCQHINPEVAIPILVMFFCFF